MIYVTSDIHGEYGQLRELLRRIHFSDADTLYVLGDVFDRGPHPIQALQYMMRYPNIIPLVGNHEYMGMWCLKYLMREVTDEAIAALNTDFLRRLANWRANGCDSTLREFHALSDNERQELIDYIAEFSLYEELTVDGTEYILVHAGLGNFSPEKPLSEYTIDELVWTRPDYSRDYYDDVYVVTGHTPTQLIPENPRPGYIYRRGHHIAIDCGACFEGGRLAAICLDTGEEFYTRE